MAKFALKRLRKKNKQFIITLLQFFFKYKTIKFSVLIKGLDDNNRFFNPTHAKKSKTKRFEFNSTTLFKKNDLYEFEQLIFC